MAVKLLDHHLKLQNKGICIRWSGKRGMSWFEMMEVIKELLGKKPPPDFLLLHTGGNDFINVPTVELCAKIAKDIDELHTLLPACSIIWSDILTRLKPLKRNGNVSIVKAVKLR
ncbi:hypothetical protein KP79_PYT22430 [Mizuhopecten yessoensis]|uniref:SGNH hydrolase-type esterase domain-containing protein n=1 Tax=Mizuhopecten yessoensis TaxID=6573 RepID=A0A210QP17_MIZYE|nr:hypothetical protein KP79_PYT22430 [Mizuhopecten yessoensis]